MTKKRKHTAPSGKKQTEGAGPASTSRKTGTGAQRKAPVKTRTPRSGVKKPSTHADKLLDALGISFNHPHLFNMAMTHRSYINELKGSERDNERLEFLGDAVLALVVNDYLYSHFEDYKEGDLAKIKSVVVSEATLARVANTFDVGRFIRIGKGEEKSGGRERPSILANTIEALIGAYYLDRRKNTRLEDCKAFILERMNLVQEIRMVSEHSYLRDPKTQLQEYVQQKYKDRPYYEVIEETGPDHRKEFRVRLLVAGREIATGVGSSKQRAEMNAAMESLKKFQDGSLDI